MPLSSATGTTSQPSEPSSPPSGAETGMQSSLAALELAHKAKMFQDMWLTLDRTAAEYQKLRDQTLRLREVQAQQAATKLGSTLPEPTQTSASMGDVLINSPTNHNYPPTPANLVNADGYNQERMVRLSKALPLVLSALLGGGASAGLLTLLGQPSPTPTNSTTIKNNTEGFNLDLGPPTSGKSRHPK